MPCVRHWPGARAVTDRLFLDANVLFTAAHRPEGKAAFLFAAQEDRTLAPASWQLLSSAYAVEEARRNLAAKFPTAMTRWPALLQGLQVVPQPAKAHLTLDLPDKDLPIWAAALGARATHLLTGDLRDFGPHMNQPSSTGGVIIQTVGDYLGSWLERQR